MSLLSTSSLHMSDSCTWRDGDQDHIAWILSLRVENKTLPDVKLWSKANFCDDNQEYRMQKFSILGFENLNLHRSRNCMNRFTFSQTLTELAHPSLYSLVSRILQLSPSWTNYTWTLVIAFLWSWAHVIVQDGFFFSNPEWLILHYLKEIIGKLFLSRLGQAFCMKIWALVYRTKRASLRQ